MRRLQILLAVAAVCGLCASPAVAASLPTVTMVTPNNGAYEGGATVLISGTNFVSGATVKFGSTASSTVTFVSATQLKAVTPAHVTGTVDVTVTTSGGTSATSSADRFTYNPPPTVTSISPNNGPLGGGNTVTINGTNFVSGMTVKFGTTAGLSVNVVSGTQLTVTAPNAPQGSYDTVVNSPIAGPSRTFLGDLYAFGPPTITSFFPTSGITGNQMSVTGTGFIPGMGVKLGQLISPATTIVTSTGLRATVPNGAISGPITVFDAQGSGTNSTTYTVTLSATGQAPDSGTPGTVVTVHGLGFNACSAVSFNGVASSDTTFVSATELMATVPTGATTGPISVINTTPTIGTVLTSANFAITGGAAESPYPQFSAINPDFCF